MLKIYGKNEIEPKNILPRDNKASGVEAAVAEIISNVRANGDKALFEYCKKFDRAELSSLKVTKAEIDEADAILVFSCGVGVQTVAARFETKPVYAGCDTQRLPGFQGVTPLEYDCKQCGECYLNETGGICPITACSKSLVNGQCGGSKNGKCEVNPEMECGWERIYRRLEKLGKLDRFDGPTRFRDYSTFEATKDHKE